MGGISGSNIVEPRSQASTSVTDTNATKERRNLLLVARNEESDAAPRDTGSVTKDAGTWISATPPEDSAEAFNEDIDSYFPRQARQPSMKIGPHDNQITLQAADPKRKRESDSKRDRIKEWLRHSGPKMLHVTATTAMEMQGSEDSAVLKEDAVNDGKEADHLHSGSNDCETTVRSDADGSESDCMQ
ncbi:hypothetical protein CBER1_05051 [Cercospora berteroae]|uniref:Uncharacterized protein n=1 Tax=Cercospora berteroae TaxID=357750 RepID=A0A2S6BRH4_9PEZI|nr:hypothetical protein CBER1_05051 [Cercospora berteroae]